MTTLLHPFWNCPNTGLGQFKYFIDAVLSRFLNKRRNRKRLYISFCMQNRETLTKFEKSSITQKNSEAFKFNPRRLTQWCKLFVSSVVGVDNSGCLWRRNWRCSLCNSAIEREQRNWRLPCGTETAMENVVEILKIQPAKNQDWSRWPDAFGLVVGRDK